MRKSLLRTLLAVLLLTAAMTPAALWLSAQQTQTDNDAEHAIRPMVQLLGAAPAYRAHTPVEPMMDIEDAWAIEDTRQEAGEPLVIGMRNGQAELGFDRESRTFYCPVGIERKEGDPWPALELFAQGREEDVQLRVSLIDEYTYDDCADAVINGYSYELLAYTQEEYEYFYLVFTGYPVVSVHTSEEIVFGGDYVPARISLADGDGTHAFSEMGRIHQRGNHESRFGYRMEFHELSAKGRDRRKAVGVLGMEADTDWVLISNAQDETRMKNKLGFDLWTRMNEGVNAINKLQSRQVEVFVQDRYMGMYQLSQRVKPQTQIAAAGGNPATDMMVRKRVYEPSGYGMNLNATNDFRLLYAYEPSGDWQRAFDHMQDYIDLTSLTEPLSDEEFIERAGRCVDVDSLMMYYLFMQMMGITVDNANNNLYIWIAWDEDHYEYRFGPWDMDLGAYGVDYLEDGSMYHWFDEKLVLAKRMLDLDALGSREKLWALWEQMRGTVFTDEEIERWVKDVEDEVYRSGAYLRETERWGDGAQFLYMDRFLEFALAQPGVLDEEFSTRWPLE